MKLRKLIVAGSAVVVAAIAQEENQPKKAEQPESLTNRAPTSVQQVIASWPARPKLGAEMMRAQYGAPQEITAEKLVWHNQGPYKRITVTKKEHHHDFPLPHMDFLEHTVSYKVPSDKADALSGFDGSATFDRTRGELSGRCDLEGHNILTLNIANDILTGKKDAEQGRKDFSQIVVDDMMGKNPAYVTSLQFQPASSPEFADQPTIPGAPVRMAAPGSQGGKNAGDAEILGYLAAINQNEIVAAMAASKKEMSSQVAEYARMLHQEHGKSMDLTLKLGQKIKTTPVITPQVDALLVKGAGELAAIVPLKGEQFGSAYINAMVKGHTEAVQMIDNQLLPKAQNQELKQHLMQTQQSIVAHLRAAQKLQGAAAGSPAASEQSQQRQSAPRPRTNQQ